VDAALPRQRGNFEVAVDATLRAAAPRQVLRQPGGIVRGNLALKIEPADLRQKVRSRRSANTVVFAVDASGSMAAAERMGETKGAVLSLLHDAHLKRDRIGLVSFRGSEAELVLAPTNDLERGRRSLARLRVGGATPLSRGLVLAHETLRRTVRRRREGALLVVISDGKANRSMNGAAGLRGLQEASQAGWHETRRAGALSPPSLLDIHYGRALEEALEVAEAIRRSGVKCLVVDTAAPSRHAQMRRVALALGAAYVHLEDLRADRLAQLVGALLRPNPTQNRR
jgi:magnesium chelatase subunit D